MRDPARCLDYNLSSPAPGPSSALTCAIPVLVARLPLGATQEYAVNSKRY